MLLGRLVSFVSGILVICAALFFGSLKELSLFDLMMSVTTMIQMPLLLPLILGLIVKRTPSWAPWVTVILGLGVSWLVANVITAVVSDSSQSESDQQQRNKLGSMVIIMGAAMMFMALIPNPTWGRVLFVICASTILFIGASLKRSARAQAPTHTGAS